MDHGYIADLLFPNVTLTAEDIEARYPRRVLPEGAKVTRFAPSPTGFVHFGGLFPSTVCERLAHQSGGVFYLRIEDTDDKREIPGAAQALIRTLAMYGIKFDEGAAITEDGEIYDNGVYGPYKQSQREEIYHVYAKKLVAEGKAYPCFTTEEELQALNAQDKKAEVKSREWTAELEAQQKAEMLKMREITQQEIEEHVKKGHPFVLRMLASGDGERKIKVDDLVKGTLELPENDKDEVLLKSNGIPTYHFAHAIDDHLMGTTHVVRGEEWLPSLPRHLMLFRYLGFKAPKYLHIAQIMRLDEDGNKKKLSKRDMGASLDDYSKLGIAPECVREYIMTLLNSNYEEWHAQNPDKTADDFPFSIKKMSVSGCLFDFNKLTDVSKNVISKMTAEKVYNDTLAWAKEYDADFYQCLASDPEYAKRILAIGRGTAKPRKDIATWADVKPYVSYFYSKYFEPAVQFDEKFDPQDIKKALGLYLEKFDASFDNSAWFDCIKQIASEIGFAPEMKLYKKSPDEYKGHVGDVSSFVRIAVTGRANTPDLYEIITIMGEEMMKERINNIIAKL